MNRNCSPLCTVPKPCLCKQCRFATILRLNPRLNKQVGDHQKLILWTKICFLNYSAGNSTALCLQQAPCKQCHFATIFVFQFFCENSDFFLFCFLDTPFGWTLDQTNKQTFSWKFDLIYEQSKNFWTTVHGYSTALPLQQAACKQCRFATILSHWHCTAELPDCPSSFLEFCRKNKFQSNFKSILDYFFFNFNSILCQKNNWKELGDGY